MNSRFGYVATGFVGIMALVASGLATQLLQDDPEHSVPIHVARPTAGVAIASLPLAAVGGDSPAAVIGAIRTYVEGVEREQLAETTRVEAARRAANEPVASPRGEPAPPRVGVASDDSTFDAFRECTIRIESGGNYEINTGNGYYGAWQFLQSTWDSVARNAGYDEWVGRRASEAPPEVQDAVARFLWEHSGNRPWGGRC